MLHLGACNTIGRFLGGPLSMLPGLNALKVHNAFLFIAGILTVLAAYANSFTWCALYAAFCGFTIGNIFFYKKNKLIILLYFSL